MSRALRWKSLDNFKRKIFLKNEIKKSLLSSISINKNIPLSCRYYAFYNRNKFVKWSTLIQQKNKCIKTGRVWSTIKLTRYSRFVFRTESYKGNLPGFRRASW